MKREVSVGVVVVCSVQDKFKFQLRSGLNGASKEPDSICLFRNDSSDKVHD